MNDNLKLGGLAALLFVISLFTYYHSVNRAERFERGQKFLSQLNADGIHQILIKRGDAAATLKRGDDQFVVAESHNYPAKNETINRFIKDVLDIGLEKAIGDGESLAKELSVVAGDAEATEVKLLDQAGKTMVHFLVGKASDDGRGNYIKRLDGEDQTIYLTSRGSYLTTDQKNFLDKTVLDLGGDEIETISFADFAVGEEDGALQLQNNVPSGKQVNSGELTKVRNLLSKFNFEDVYLADDSKVSGLRFDTNVNVQLKDQSGYEVKVSKSGEEYFMTVKGIFEIDKIELSREESEEELQDKAEILERSEEINSFNSFHGSWVYKINEATAAKFRLSFKDMLEDIPKEEDS